MKRFFTTILTFFFLTVSAFGTSSMFTNRYLSDLHKGGVDWSNDSFKIILMQSSYTFDYDTHDTYSDVSASELATNYGYTQNTKTLASVTVTESSSGDFSLTFADVTWTASGGEIGPVSCALIIDDTHASDIVVGCIWFGANRTAADGTEFAIRGNSLGR